MPKTSRARTDIGEISANLMADLDRCRSHMLATGNQATKDAYAGIETFCAIALRVLAKTNPSKLRDAAMTVEIAARLKGREVIEA